MRGRSTAAPAHPYLQGGIYLGTIPWDPHPYLLPAADRHHAILLHLVAHLAVGPSPVQRRPPHAPSDGRPREEHTHATPGPKRAIALLPLKAEATIPRDLEGENHLRVEELTEHVPIAAIYATAAASHLCEDRRSPPLAQAAQDAPSTGLTAEDIHRILHMQAPRKKHPVVGPIQLVSWDAMDAPPATTEVHILKHRDICWTVEWEDLGKVRLAAAHAPDDEIPPPPRGGDACNSPTASRTPERQPGKRCTMPCTGCRGRQEAPFPRNAPPHGHATRPAPQPTCAATGQALGTGSSPCPRTRLTPLQGAKKTLGIMTKQVFQLKDARPHVQAPRPSHP